MAESDLQPNDLVPIFASESVVLDLLNYTSQLTDDHIQELATFFHISPISFR